MNLAEALNAALPELPARRTRTGYPKLDPALIHRENIEDGEPVVVALVRGSDKIFRFSVAQWKLIELFDGTRSCEDVANLHAEMYGVVYDPEDLQEYASGLDEIDFWFKTPLEKNIALQQKLEANRHQHSHRKSKWGDVAHMQFSAWDPDRYFNRIYPGLQWLYSRWFTALTLVLFSLMLVLFAANWSQIGQDTLQFYTFTEKSSADLAEFWILFLILGFFHESAHGLTCKHYGAEVHAMGFHLIYLTPAFFVDVSEAWVYATRWQRFVTIIAGIWVEMIFCAIATLVWWATPSGSNAHELAYKIMLITGVAVVVVNMNPLIKLDGYYAFSEIIGFSDIKEKSTAYLSGLVRRAVFRLPVEMEFVPRRRRAGYVLYAILSGIYSYSLLFTVIRFCHNVFLHSSPQWAFVPALVLGLFIFRSRIRTLLRFLRTVYLDKKDRVRSWFTVPRTAGSLAILSVVLFAPLWHETVTARFVLEPASRALVRTTVPGRVTSVLAHEGQTVSAGEPLLQTTNARLQSMRESAQWDLDMARLHRVQTQLAHGELGSALQEHARATAEREIVNEESGQLTPASPIGGTVMTARLNDLSGSYLGAGSVIAEVADTSRMRARMFVLEYAVARVRLGAPVHLLAEGAFRPLVSHLDSIQPAPQEAAAGLEPTQKLSGATQLKYYAVEALVSNDGSLRDGMVGTARIEVRRRSLAGLIGTQAREFFDRKVW